MVNYVEPNYEIIKIQPFNDYTPLDKYKIIEESARTCYQSFDYTTDDSYQKIIKMLIERGHESMLEHASIAFKVHRNFMEYGLVHKIADHPNYLRISYSEENGYIVSGNIRAIRDLYKNVFGRHIAAITKKAISIVPQCFIEHDLNSMNSVDDSEVNLITNNCEFNKNELLTHQCVSVRFKNVPRGFTHEMVRMRCLSQNWMHDSSPIFNFHEIMQHGAYINEVSGKSEANEYLASEFVKLGQIMANKLEYNIDGFSFAQESTRYVDNSKDKFGKCINVVETPYELSPEARKWFNYAYTCVEEAYLCLRNLGIPQEIARDVLPIGLKSEIVCTGTLKNWYHVLKLRASKYAHPIMRQVMIPLLKEMCQLYPSIFISLKEELNIE